MGELIAEGNSLSSGNQSITTFTPNGDEKDKTSIKEYEVNYIMIKVRKIDTTTGNFIPDVDARYVTDNESVLNVIMGIQDINFWIADTSVNVDFKSNRIYFALSRGNCKNISYQRVMSSFWTDYRNPGADGKPVLKPVVELVDDLEFTYADNTLNLLD